MKIEVMIYAYLAICAAMICFNIACIFIFRRQDKRLDKYSRRFIEVVSQAIEMQSVTTEHCDYLSKALKKTNNLMAFEKTLDELLVKESESVYKYLEEITPVFVRLTLEYKKKNKMYTAYFFYIVKKYRIFQKQSDDAVMETLLEVVRSPELYIRENALQAIYSIGSEEYVQKALLILNDSKEYHHPKMIADGLLNFTGNTQRLDTLLWESFEYFSIPMQLAILNYFRFCSSAHCERILKMLTSPDLDDELAYSCIRYLGKYTYAPAYSVLLRFAEEYQHEQWEYSAIAATALANYPGDRTEAVLKELLQNTNWHVRYNASQSLMALGLYYTDLIDVFEGSDRYASEILRYRFDQQKLEEEKTVV